MLTRVHMPAPAHTHAHMRIRTHAHLLFETGFLFIPGLAVLELTLQTRLALNTEFLLSAGTQGVHHHAQLSIYFLTQSQVMETVTFSKL